MAEGERRSVVDEKRYAIVTKESISMMAESGGHDDIDDTIAGILGEDVSYRLREITQVVIIIMLLVYCFHKLLLIMFI